MPSKFDVTPEEMNRSAKLIFEKTQQFVDTYQDIYNAVSELNVKYQGEASQTFNARIEGYRNDFTAAREALNKYYAFLTVYADQVSKIENEIKGNASRLSVGK